VDACLYAEATASSAAPGHGIESAVDGGLGNGAFWQSLAGVENVHVQVNLGTRFSIQRVELCWRSNFSPKRYTLEVLLSLTHALRLTRSLAFSLSHTLYLPLSLALALSLSLKHTHARARARARARAHTHTHTHGEGESTWSIGVVVGRHRTAL
jgi:hypothetical protein